MADADAVIADLEAESADLDRIVADLDPAQWRQNTPAKGWTIAHQIGHLAWTDAVAHLSATNPDGFQEVVKQAWTDPYGFVDKGAEQWAAKPPGELLDQWRDGRAKLAQALLNVPAGTKLTWFGPPMSAVSMATARLMETWAHGQDVADALGVRRAATDRLRNIAHLGVRTRDFAYAVNNQTPPAEPFRYELTSPSGQLWTWGPEDAAQRITGSAEDFCALVTQRRHRDDLDLQAEGADAAHWMTIAQVFAESPGTGREKGQFA